MTDSKRVFNTETPLTMLRLTLSESANRLSVSAKTEEMVCAMFRSYPSNVFATGHLLTSLARNVIKPCFKTLHKKPFIFEWTPLSVLR